MITVTLNSQKTIGHCIESVAAQNYNNVEYIIIDGGSTDGTLQIIDQHRQHISHLISEPDKGIYDAMNKGISLATGDIIGILNSDDIFAYKEILFDVADVFKKKNTDIVFGNLNYINPEGVTKRRWVSGTYNHGMFNWGWMPPHPTFYCKRSLYKEWGLYNLQFGTAADYELMLRFIHLNKAKTAYLNKVMVNMVVGGVSNRSYYNRFNAWVCDFRAMKKNGVIIPLLCVVFKPLRKIFQYV
nr:glycosyltransferase family 2 protein [Mucilaginibacter sp. UR6-11]